MKAISHNREKRKSPPAGNILLNPSLTRVGKVIVSRLLCVGHHLLTIKDSGFLEGPPCFFSYQHTSGGMDEVPGGVHGDRAAVSEAAKPAGFPEPDDGFRGGTAGTADANQSIGAQPQAGQNPLERAKSPKAGKLQDSTTTWGCRTAFP